MSEKGEEMVQKMIDRVADSVVHKVEQMVVDGPKLLSLVWAGLSGEVKGTLRVLIRGAVVQALNEELEEKEEKE